MCKRFAKVATSMSNPPPSRGALGRLVWRPDQSCWSGSRGVVAGVAGAPVAGNVYRPHPAIYICELNLLPAMPAIVQGASLPLRNLQRSETATARGATVVE
jgi:hypothetical protein